MDAPSPPPAASRLPPVEAWVAGAALVLMVLLPLIEIAVRPLWGQGIDNAPVLVQHLGLVLAMFGAVAAARGERLASLGSSLARLGGEQLRPRVEAAVDALSALLCGMLVLASWRFVDSERLAAQTLAYGLPIWTVQAVMPVGFALLGVVLGQRVAGRMAGRWTSGLLLPLAGFALAAWIDGHTWPAGPTLLVLAVLLLVGAPVFAVVGGLAIALFVSEGLPLASVALSHYQITVNASLPALPLFTLAGLVFARTGAAQRLGSLFIALFGSGARGTIVAAAVLCSVFTAFTGGSGVTILALGGLLLPLLLRSGCPEPRAIGLVTSASALGVLLAPSVPLIMVAVIARVPIVDMFLAGLLPAVLMVVCLLVVGGFLRRVPSPAGAELTAAPAAPPGIGLAAAAWAAKWELGAPVVALAPLVAGLATPTEIAALTAAYAVATQSLVHRELGLRRLGACLRECVQIIGGVMLILGMALALTNFFVDAGIPDLAVEWAREVFPNRYVFLIALCLFLAAAAALMEIFAAIVVLVPLLLPLAMSYGMDPLHFSIVFLAAMEVGFLCPPAGMNLYFASAMFGRSVGEVARSVLPALLAILLGTVLIACFPWLTHALPQLAASMR